MCFNLHSSPTKLDLELIGSENDKFYCNNGCEGYSKFWQNTFFDLRTFLVQNGRKGCSRITMFNEMVKRAFNDLLRVIYSDKLQNDLNIYFSTTRVWITNSWSPTFNINVNLVVYFRVTYPVEKY